MWPQYVLLGLMVMGLGSSLAKHGQPKKGDESFTWSLIGSGLTFWLLYEGGFFKGML